MTKSRTISLFIADTGGNIATMFALLLFPLLLSIGAAIDYNRYQTTAQRIYNAQEIALKSAAGKIRSASFSNPDALQAELEAEFNSFFAVNFDAINNSTTYNSKLVVDADKLKIGVAITATQDTMFLGLIGKNQLQHKSHYETRFAPESFIGNIAECINATGALRDVRDAFKALEKLGGVKLRLPKMPKYHDNTLQTQLAKRLKFQRRSKNARKLCASAFPAKPHK